ncbi:MAG: type II toxin-antitoxin system HicB family antitoxin [bacterium]|nr:type II toxin-antitoxin system HicB family antitoxin [bacterium]
MTNEFTGVFEKDGAWYIGYCPEVPGANGQGKTIEECRESLTAAIKLILDEEREQGLSGVPPDAIRERVVVR